mgnify:CR=1 FL=1
MGMEFDTGLEVGKVASALLIDADFIEVSAVVELAQHHHGVGRVTIGPLSIPVELAHLTWEQLKVVVGYTYLEDYDAEKKRKYEERKNESRPAQIIRYEKFNLGRRRN